MKKTIMTISLLLTLLLALPVWANQEHHQDTASSPTVQMDVKRMQEARKKMETTAGSAEQKQLMHQHMEHMKEGMSMMEMMGGKDSSDMPMAGRMQMMENKMEMMEEMMKGLMSQQEMMMKKE